LVLLSGRHYRPSAYLVKMPCPPPSPETRPSRKQLREGSLARRNAQDLATIAAWSTAVQEHLLAQWPTPPGRVIGFCWPIGKEPDVRPLLDTWAGTRPMIAALPVVIDPASALRFRAWSAGAAMVTDRYGIPTPAAGDFIQPEVLLIPLNAFDRAGYRIGYGGGFFDRTLAEMKPRPLAIGIGFEIGRVDDVRPEPHDQRLDWIVTEAGAWKT
jgi:5,10-methenyltetrahydrofolate synthetase